MGDPKIAPLEANRRAELERLASNLGITICDLALFDRALTHASALDKPGPRQDYESLEFVGDAVLGLAIAHYLYETIPDRTPGEYSKIRASVVNRRTLARVAARMELAPAILLGRGEEKAGGRNRNALLADCVEALLGAVYLDRGWDTVKEFIERTFAPELGKSQSVDRIWDFKSRLQTYCQAKRMDLPEFKVVHSAGPDHKKEFEVEVTLRGVAAGRGAGPSKKEAEQQAARVALQAEGELPE